MPLSSISFVHIEMATLPFGHKGIPWYRILVKKKKIDLILMQTKYINPIIKNIVIKRQKPGKYSIHYLMASRSNKVACGYA
jgi:hypothetical protein